MNVEYQELINVILRKRLKMTFFTKICMCLFM